MSLIVINYVPGAGGNHLKNLLCLSDKIANYKDLNLAVYDIVQEAAGTVHSSPDRNVSEERLTAILSDTQGLYVMCGHFGELARYRSLLLSMQKTVFLTITFDQAHEQQWLKDRNQRLDQHVHPYWFYEEQPFLYQKEMCVDYWHADSVLEIPLVSFWDPDATNFVRTINDFLALDLCLDRVQPFHTKWWHMNFDFEFTKNVREFYGVD